MADVYATFPVTGGSGGVPTYANFAAFPSPSAAGSGALALALDTDLLYASNGTSWVIIGGPGVPVSVGAFDSGTPSVQGAHIDSDALIMQSASPTVPGLVNTGAQTLAGAKTFSSAPVFSSLTASTLLALDGSKNVVSQATGNLTDAGTDGITVTGGTGAVVGSGTGISQRVADTTHNGYLSSTDWNTFNGKQPALTIGNLTDAGTDGIVVTGGTGAVIGTGTSLAQHVADTTHNGYLSSTDWNTFNGKGTGTVTAVSVVSTNGLAGSSSGGATPALTLSTTITGILQGNGTAISAATTTGTGNVVLATGPTMTLPNATGLPLTTGVTGTLGIGNGGSGQVTANDALNAFLPTQTSNNGKALVTDGSNTAWTSIVTNPMTTLGDIIYENATPAPARLAGNTTATNKFLTQTGTGSISAVPGWNTIVAADLPAATSTTQGAVSIEATGSLTTSFTFNGSGSTSSSVTIKYSRSGKIITILMPVFDASSGTGSTAFTSNTAITDTWALPVGNNLAWPCWTKSNNVGTNIGILSYTTGGIFVLNYTASTSAWPNALTGSGFTNQTSFTFTV